ncbi:gluconokinase, partial [Pseudomonas sp. NPDC088429]
MSHPITALVIICDAGSGKTC